MRIRGKLFVAQVPLIAALAITSIVGVTVTQALGRGSRDILKDNYRSVLAAERMKEAAERIDSGITFTIAGRPADGATQIDANIAVLERELAAEEDNITERGERDAAAKLHAAWTAYSKHVAAVRPRFTSAEYFPSFLPEFLAVKNAADVILAMNQDAMIRKSDSAQKLADDSNRLLLAVSILGLALGVIASSIMTIRVLRPLAVVGATARRLGEGDLEVRARVTSQDEIGELAHELNTMADHIQRYRRSSLGELLEAQLAAQATIDSLPDAVLVIGLDGNLRHANQAAETMLKVSPEASNALSVLEPGVRAVVEKLRAHVASGHGAYVPKGLEETVVLPMPDGPRALLPRAAPLYAEEGDVVAVTVVLQDVTRLRRFEELRNDLVATVAHEVRTPLTSLRMAVHLLSENAVGPLTEKQADLVFAAREECERLQGIVDDLLDLSRIQADRIELRLVEVDPTSVVEAAIAAHRAEAEARGATIEMRVAAGMPAVRADRDRAALVLGNLLSNAIRYAGGEIEVSAKAVDGEARFAVTDHGPGVPAEYAQTIFERYVRVPDSPPGGAGLGLFIAGEIVRAHGGEIGVASEPGRGATFWFTLPLGVDELPTPQPVGGAP